MTLNRRFVFALGFAALLGVTAVQAQDQQYAKIPFAFEVGGKQVQAGTYSTTREVNGLVVVRNNETSEKVFLVPILAKQTSPGKSSITFKRYGSRYFLRTIQFGSQGSTYEVMASRHEKELAKVETPKVVMVAMR